jgi:uncharacterized protein
LAKSSIDSFPPGVAERLKYYVYRLIDPRDGTTFYVGKGKGNRLFSHIKEERDLDGDAKTNKLQHIHEIRHAGLDVIHIVHRHGLSESEAMHVEAALIDAFPGLENEVSGSSSDLGAMNAKQIVEAYAAPIATLDEPTILIIVNRSATEGKSLYDATRYSWKIQPTKAKKAKYVMAVIQGIIRDVFIAEAWLPATTENFPGFVTVEERFGFHGKDAPESVKARYVGKRVPDEYRKPGAANPIRYTFK